MDWLDKKKFDIHGRHLVMDDVLYLSYSASYVDFYFSGDTIKAVVFSDGKSADNTFDAWISVFADGSDVAARHLRLQKGTHEYLIYDRAIDSKDANGAVRIRIMKMTEAAFASVGIKTLLFDGDIEEHDFEKKPALIEFIGDSITCGYGVEAPNEQSPFDTREENPWEAYACKTARNLGFDFELVSWSGNGIISHYIDPETTERRINPPLMPDLYAYTDRELETRLGRRAFSEYKPERKPDYVVVNLGTNDCSYTRQIPERNGHFKAEFKGFIEDICRINEQASIIIIYGIMDDRLNTTIKEMVRELKKTDGQVFEIGFELQLDSDGRGADNHPSKITHDKTADRLARFIRSIS